MRSTTTMMVVGMLVFVAANVLVLGYAISLTGKRAPEYSALASNASPAPTQHPVGPPADPVKLQAAMSIGQTEYTKCAACHGPDGKGVAVAGTAMAPSLVGSPIATGDVDRAALVVLKGIRKESAQYTGIMAPLPIDDSALAGVLTFVRNSFGNSAGLVTPEEAAAARTRFASVPMLIGRGEIDGLLASNPKVQPSATMIVSSGASAGITQSTTEAPRVEQPWVPIDGIAVVGGRVPSERPEGAPPRPSYAVKDTSWYENATHGLVAPYPASMKFLEEQGNWYTPFTRPGMTGPYDIRHWHVD